MSSDPVYTGQTVLIETAFLLNGVPTDPTLLTLVARSPTGSKTTLTYPDPNYVRRSTGLFEASVAVLVPGVWWFRAEGVGVVNCVNEYSLEVARSGMNG
jgi:hypothetical protein